MIELLTTDSGALVQAMTVEFGKLASPEWYRMNYAALFQVIMIDVVLAGDNAIVVGLAASRVAPDIRSRVIFWGIAGAVILRILFASVTLQLLAIVGLTLAGGILLLWVCWKMYRQIIDDEGAQLAEVEAGLDSTTTKAAAVSFSAAVTQIVVADLSMSLDNVLAVAGAAKGEPLVLVIGLAFSVLLMAIAAHFIAGLLVKYPWVTWIGLLIILYVALDMVYRGSYEVICQTFQFGCSEDLMQELFGRLGIPWPWDGVGVPGH